MPEARDEDRERFAEIIRMGGVICCTPAYFAALRSQTQPGTRFGGVEIRSSVLVPPNTLYALQRSDDLPPFTDFVIAP